MPADRLTRTEAAVLHVLAGAQPEAVAHGHGLDFHDLTAAVQTYRQAGRRALRDRVDDPWWQVNVEFADYNQAELVAATVLAPILRSAAELGLLDAWWFIRKRPQWRFRLRRGPSGQALVDQMSAKLDNAVTEGTIARWRPHVYEPETAAFGGPTGITIAHDLFAADSRALLYQVNRASPFAPLGRREMSMILCQTLMRAAGLERYETGDVWHRVTLDRQVPNLPTTTINTIATDLRRLTLADTNADGSLFGPTGPLADNAAWATPFHQAGAALQAAACDGTLERGIRQVISHHVIFHWNRIGLPLRTQAILAHAARTAILDA